MPQVSLTEKQLNELIGQKVNHLTIIRRRPDLDTYHKKSGYKRYYEYECDCPDHTHGFINYHHIKNGSVNACMHCSRARKFVDNNIGNKFGKLTLLGLDNSRPIYKNGVEHRESYVRCKCDCGNYTSIRLSSIRGSTRHTNSCGCLQPIATGLATMTHGLSSTRLYKIHAKMGNRCYNINDAAYSLYGGRGIYICKEWWTPYNRDIGLLNFLDWSYQNGYHDQPKGTPFGDLLSIDRIDPNGPYAPWNCRWIPLRDQSSNTRSNIIYTIFGAKYTISDIAYYTNKDPNFYFSRLFDNWPMEAIVYAAVNPELNLHKIRGKQKYVDQDGFTHLLPVLNHWLYRDVFTRVNDFELNEAGKYMRGKKKK